VVPSTEAVHDGAVAAQVGSDPSSQTREPTPMAVSISPGATDRSGRLASDPLVLRVSALGGLVGVALRLVFCDPFSSTKDSIVGYPQSGVGPATAETLGVALVALAVISSYRSIARRGFALRIGGVALGSAVILASAGTEIAFDGAIVGSVVLAIGLALALGPEQSAVGWLGVLAGSLVLAAALPPTSFEASRQAREGAQVAALASAGFIVALSVRLWRLADGTVPSLEGAR